MEPGTDYRADAIAKMNDALRALGKPLLTPRQEHLVREFTEDDGTIRRREDGVLLQALLASNSS